MESLLVANFEDDTEYNGIELQIFNDKIKGTGAALIMYRVDDKLDFYITPGVNLKRDDMEVGAGVGEFIEQEFSYIFEVTEHGLDALIELTLHDGKPVVLSVKENRKKQGKGINILAPLGVGILKPKHFPLFMMYNLDLIRRGGTELSFTIGNKPHEIIKIPIPMPYNFKKVCFARYCLDPLIGLFNNKYDGALAKLEPNQDSIRHEHMTYDLVQNDGHYEIRRASTNDTQHEIYITFSPPLPDIVSLKNDIDTSGRFSLGADEDGKIIQGAYAIKRQGKHVSMSLEPTEKWTPRGFLTKITLMFFPSFFRTWPKTYRWTSEINLDTDSEPVMQSNWARTE